MAESDVVAQGASYVPLQTRTGIFAGDFLRTHVGKGIVIWGAGVLGRCLMRQLQQFAMPGQSFHFTDSNSNLYGTMIEGKRVLDFDEALEYVRSGSCFMVVAVAGHIKSAMARLTEACLKPVENFDSYLKLSRPEAVIQVSSRCGDRVENMAPDVYQAILAKLKADIPDIFHVDLSGWGDPLDNPHLAGIIRATLQIVPCTVTTRLMAEHVDIEQALLAAPTQFVVSVNGYEASYRDNTPGGDWEAFLDRLRYLSAIQGRISGKTEIRLKYNLFRNNDGGDFRAMRSLCEQLGIKMVKSIGYIDTYDTTLRLCESGVIDHAEPTLMQNLAWPLQDALRWAKVDQGQPCLCQRIFPVIHTDGSVGICHLYLEPRIHDHYLSIDFDTLQRLRIGADHCRICQRNALHRLDIDVLQSRHAIQLLPPPENAHA